VHASLESLVVGRREPMTEHPQGRCLDNGDEDDEVSALVQAFGFPAHVRPRGEEARAITRDAGFTAHRWGVERAHSWMKRCRRLRIRWETKPAHALAFLHGTCGVSAFRAAGFVGHALVRCYRSIDESKRKEYP